MGNYLQTETTWYVYRRCLTTDEWVSTALQEWHNITLEIALKRFKHEVYTFALGKHVEYSDTKSIYLYNGKTRVAKAHQDSESGQMDIWSTSIREWLVSTEELAPQRYPLLEVDFFSKHVQKHAWIDTQTITFVKK